MKKSWDKAGKERLGIRPADKEDQEIIADPEPVFPLDALPENVRGWVVDVAKRKDHAPVSMSATAALLAMATAVGRRCLVKPKQKDDWAVVPNLWGALVGPPSVKKSPIFSDMTAPLRRWEIEQEKLYKEEMRIYAVESARYEARLKAYKKELEAGKNPPPPEEPEHPVRRRVLVNDATVEKVGELMIENPTGLGLHVDELSRWLNTMRRAGRESDRGFWLEAFNGDGSQHIDRIGRGSMMIPHVCATIFGTIQPAPLFRLVEKAIAEDGGGDGLIQRFQLLVTVDTPISEYADYPPSAFYREGYRDLIYLLLEADYKKLGAEEDPFTEALSFRFSPEASEVFRRFQAEINRQIREAEITSPAYAAHLGKAPKTFTGLALLLYLSDKVFGLVEENVIPGKYAERARILTDFYLWHARKIYSAEAIREQKLEELHKKILEKVREMQTAGLLPLSFGEISQRIRGARAADIREALTGYADVEGKKVVRVTTEE